MSQDFSRPLAVVIVGHVDHGKSTLIGRLLHDTGSLPEGKVEQLRAASLRRGAELEWSFLLDALQIERDQGITVDSSQVWLNTAKRRYVIIDAPGHKQFIKNMATGASAADAAILIVDAVQGAAEQTRRHARLLSLMGVSQVAVIVNKMDLIDWDQARFQAVAQETRDLIDGFGMVPVSISPISARHGDMMVERLNAPAWVDAPTVVEVFDNFSYRPNFADLPFRMSVQDVYRRGDAGEKRLFVGRIETGRIRVGDRLLVLPNGMTSKVAALESWGPGPEKITAVAGESIAIRFEDEVFGDRGAVLTDPAHSPHSAHEVSARVFWLGGAPLGVGDAVTLRIGSAEQTATVSRVDEVEEPGAADGARQIGRGGVARLTLSSRRPMTVDRFVDNPRFCRVALVRDGVVMGGGVVEQLIERNVTAVDFGDRKVIRSARFGHRGGVLWLTGLSGAGKSTVAAGAIARLDRRGFAAQVLDGDNLRLGLNRDLGFTVEDRSENIRRIAEVAKLFKEAGLLAIVSAISPLAADRAAAREIIGDGFHEVFVDAALDTCKSRDPKGLYARAAAGKIPEFTGLTSPYEAPDHPELRIDADHLSADAAADLLAAYADQAFSTELDAIAI